MWIILILRNQNFSSKILAVMRPPPHTFTSESHLILLCCSTPSKQSELLVQHDEPFKSITKSITDVSLAITEGSLEDFRDIIKELPQKSEISMPGRPKCFIAIGISIAAMAMSMFNAVRITQLNKEKTDLNLDINDVVQVAKKKNLVPFVKFALDLFQIEVSHLYTLAMDEFTLIHHILMVANSNLLNLYKFSVHISTKYGDAISHLILVFEW